MSDERQTLLERADALLFKPPVRTTWDRNAADVIFALVGEVARLSVAAGILQKLADAGCLSDDEQAGWWIEANGWKVELDATEIAYITALVAVGAVTDGIVRGVHNGVAWSCMRTVFLADLKLYAAAVSSEGTREAEK